MPSPKDPVKRKLWIQRLSESHKGQVPWCKGKKLGYTPKMYGLAFHYVGDSKLIVDGKCPDFSDGNGNLIELFGVEEKMEY